MAKIGIFTSGGPFALELISAVVEAVKSGHIPNSKISFVFCDHEQGEWELGDRMLRYVKSAGLTLINFSYRNFEVELRKKDKEKWRVAHDEKTIELVPKTDFDLLLGWMWWFSKLICKVRTMVNLHPALPNGPRGTFVEVIWELIRQRVIETGIMMHLTTEDWDNGTVVSFCRFPIRGQRFDSLWAKICTGIAEDINKTKAELFQNIRRAGTAREINMVLWTARALAEGTIRIVDRKILDSRGNVLNGGYNLTKKIEAGIIV